MDWTSCAGYGFSGARAYSRIITSFALADTAQFRMKGRCARPRRGLTNPPPWRYRIVAPVGVDDDGVRRWSVGRGVV